MRLTTAKRLIHINWIIVYYGLDEIILGSQIFRPLRLLLFLSPNYWLRKPIARAIRIRQALEHLGPIYIKFGQILSTRKDLLADDISVELIKLQDQCQPFDGNIAKQIIAQQLGKQTEKLFASFDLKPLASASIAQVHNAKLHSGEEVVVKILRPNIEKTIRADLDLLYALAHLAGKFWSHANTLRAGEIIEEFERSLMHELDLNKEAANAERLRANFVDCDILYIPKIYPEFSRQKVLVIEKIHGIPVGDMEKLQAANANFKLLAERGVEIFFTQVFRDNFFHADVHPGNIFIAPPDKYISIDFGIVGVLSESDQRYLAENFLAFFNRDYKRVADMHIESGWVSPDTDAGEFEQAIRLVCEPIFAKPLKDISFGLLLLGLFQTARRFGWVVQPQLVLLQKTLLNIEGLGRQLYPQLDLWQTAKPFLQDWFKKRTGSRATLQKLAKQLPEIINRLPQMPTLVVQALHNSRHHRRQLDAQQKELAQLRLQLGKNHRHTLLTILTSAALISASIFFG